MIKRHITETIEEFNEEGIMTCKTTTETEETDDNNFPSYVGSVNIEGNVSLEKLVEDIAAKLKG